VSLLPLPSLSHPPQRPNHIAHRHLNRPPPLIPTPLQPPLHVSKLPATGWRLCWSMSGWARNDVNSLATMASGGVSVRGEAVLLPPAGAPAGSSSTDDEEGQVTAALLAAALGPRLRKSHQSHQRPARRRASASAPLAASTPPPPPPPPPPPQRPPPPPLWDDLPAGVMALIARAVCGASMDEAPPPAWPGPAARGGGGDDAGRGWQQQRRQRPGRRRPPPSGGSSSSRLRVASLPPAEQADRHYYPPPLPLSDQEVSAAAAAAAATAHVRPEDDQRQQQHQQAEDARAADAGDDDDEDTEDWYEAQQQHQHQQHDGRHRRHRHRQRRPERGRPALLAPLCAVSAAWRRAVLGDDALLRGLVQFAAAPRWRPPPPPPPPPSPAPAPSVAPAAPPSVAATERLPMYTTTYSPHDQKLCDCHPRGLPPPLHTRRRLRPLGAPRERDDDPLGVAAAAAAAAAAAGPAAPAPPSQPAEPAGPPPPPPPPPPAPAADPDALPSMLLRAARLGNRSAQVAAARALDQAGAQAAALRWWRRASKGGHGEAALRYGVAAYRGLGSPMMVGGGSAAGRAAWWGGEGKGEGEGEGGGFGASFSSSSSSAPRLSAAYASPAGREGVEEAALALARVLRPLVAAVAAREARALQQQPEAAAAAPTAAPPAAASTAAAATAAAVDAALADPAVHPSLRACPRPLLREALLVHSFIALDGEGATGKSDVEAAVRALRAARALGCNEAAKTLGYLYNTGQFGAASAW
jgi:hypothetical protein